MFTGIIKDIGKIHSILKKQDSISLVIESQKIPLHFLQIGESISCNGCCLTVTSVKSDHSQIYFSADIGPETLKVTRFSTLAIGDSINLEPALQEGSLLGGHKVTGHIDCLGEVTLIESLENGFWKLNIAVPEQYNKYIIPKGSIAICGISLTIQNSTLVCNLNSVLIEIMIIPFTYKSTILPSLKENFNVEVEFDSSIKTLGSLLENMIPKYIQKHFEIFSPKL